MFGACLHYWAARETYPCSKVKLCTIGKGPVPLMTLSDIWCVSNSVLLLLLLCSLSGFSWPIPKPNYIVDLKGVCGVLQLLHCSDNTYCNSYLSSFLILYDVMFSIQFTLESPLYQLDIGPQSLHLLMADWNKNGISADWSSANQDTHEVKTKFT
jgi:hypothetical protein